MAVTTVAIMGTILMGFALSSETKTVEYDDWEYITNVSGLFETSQTPQYVQYNPSANWTGYSLTNGGLIGGINYSTSQNANLYPIEKGPTYVNYTNLNIVNMNLNQASPPTSSKIVESWGVVYNSTDTFKPVYGNNGNNITTNKPNVTTLKTIYDALDGDSYDQLTIKLDGTMVWCKASDWTLSTWVYSGGGVTTKYTVYTLNTDYASTAIPTGTITMTKATMSATFTATGGSPQLIGNLDDVHLVYGGSGTGEGQIVLGTTITGQKITNVTPIYMDPSQGVSLSGTSGVYWNNGYTVSKMDILFRAPTSSGTYFMQIVMPDDNSGPFSRNFLDFNYSQSEGITIYMGHADANTGAVISVNENIGKWRNCIVSLDLINQMITTTPIIKYTNMFDYTTSDDIRTLDFSGIGSKLIPTDKFIFRSPLSDNPSPLFGVINTEVFMDTYGVVMVNPRIDPFALFPQYAEPEETLRIDFRSFAIYGSGPIFFGMGSMGFGLDVDNGVVTFNGKSYDLAGGMTVDITKKATVYDYVIRINGETIPDPYGNQIGIDNSTVLLYGNWYMETDVYHGVVKSKEVTEFTFDTFVFDSNSAIMCYLGLLILGTAVGARYAGASWTDMIIILFAGICGFILMTVG